MPKQSLQVRVESAVLVWARESAGWSVEDIAHKLKVTSDIIREWETGKLSLTLTMIERLANYYKRPLSAFLLSEPPPQPPPPKDYRTVIDRQNQFSKDTRLAIRRAQRLQNVVAELAEELGLDSRARIGAARLDEVPEQVAQRERERLGIDSAQQRKWKNYSGAFQAWRNTIENANILVFRFAMPTEDARGFSLGEKEPFVIVVSASDAIVGTIFTLFHEYAHLLLHQPGICIPEELRSNDANGRNVEYWCNRFAGEMLVPEQVIHTDGDFQIFIGSQDLETELLDKLSRRLKVSAEVILLRMLTAHLITRQRYEDTKGYLETQRQKKPKKEKAKPIRVSQAQICLQQKGRLFTSVVLQGRHKDLVTYSDVADYLSLRVKHFDSLQLLLER